MNVYNHSHASEEQSRKQVSDGFNLKDMNGNSRINHKGFNKRVEEGFFQ